MLLIHFHQLWFNIIKETCISQPQATATRWNKIDHQNQIRGRLSNKAQNFRQNCPKQMSKRQALVNYSRWRLSLIIQTMSFSKTVTGGYFTVFVERPSDQCCRLLRGRQQQASPDTYAKVRIIWLKKLPKVNYHIHSHQFTNVRRIIATWNYCIQSCTHTFTWHRKQVKRYDLVLTSFAGTHYLWINMHGLLRVYDSENNMPYRKLRKLCVRESRSSIGSLQHIIKRTIT